MGGKENTKSSLFSKNDTTSQRLTSSKKNNVFDVLMNKVDYKHCNTKRQRLCSATSCGINTPTSTYASGLSRFANCPICLKNIPIASIEFHTEQCLEQFSKTPSTSTQPTTTGLLATNANDEEMSKSKEKKVITDNCSTSNNNSTVQKNAFQHLMNQSKLLARPPLQQRFHLHSDLTVTWDDIGQDSGASATTAAACLDCPRRPEVQWSAMTVLESPSGCPQEEEERSVELIVSSSIPSSPIAPSPLMSKLSKLSIPVLKSMIQKSIRRQRPHQATKLAMELSDKSWGDLLRRLPIIMLEDALLHPDLPLLVWLMVADTKNYIVNSTIVDRVMSTVYELASCPWRDKATFQKEKDIEISLNKNASSVHGLDVQHQTMIKSMLLRAKYGGMLCDVVMMHNYAQLWMCRFQSDLQDNHSVCHTVILQDDKGVLSTSTSWQQSQLESKNIIPWTLLPSKLYQSFREEYEQIGRTAVQNYGEEGCVLHLEDLCTEGVDFHCSHILNILLKEHKDSLLSILHHHLKVQDNPKDELLRSWCQKAMWKHSSGVNVKQCFSQDSDDDIGNEDESSGRNKILMSSLWNLMEPHVGQFCKKYLLLRIVLP